MGRLTKKRSLESSDPPTHCFEQQSPSCILRKTSIYKRYKAIAFHEIHTVWGMLAKLTCRDG